jgi:group I intron endonuclease
MERTGKIYKIVNTLNDKIYVGSTQLQYLSKRMSHHKENCIKEPNCGKLYPAMIEFGIDNFKIILLEKIQFTDKEELRAREYDWIVKLDSVNNGYNTLYKDGKLPQASMLKTRKGLVKFYKETNKDVGIYYSEGYVNKKGNFCNPRWRCKWMENGKLKSKSFNVLNIQDTDKMKELARQYRNEQIKNIEVYN